MQELFEKIQEVQETKQTEVTLSYLEIYNETIRDLLNEDGLKTTLMLREDANQTVSVAGLSSHRPQSVSGTNRRSGAYTNICPGTGSHGHHRSG
jgi:kinesin family protein 18/19